MVDKLIKMAESVRKMEKDGDHSMRGYFIDELVTNYVETFGDDFINMFEYIMTHQKDVYGSYGDFDSSVTKLKIVGDIVENDRFTDKYDYTSKAMFLDDIFCGYRFIIIEVVQTLKEVPTMIKKSYHVHSANKKHKSIKVKEYTGVCYNSKIIEYKKDYFSENATIVSDHMIYKYVRFKQLIDSIRNPYLQLRSKVEGVSIDSLLKKCK